MRPPGTPMNTIIKRSKEKMAKGVGLSARTRRRLQYTRKQTFQFH
jgi:hypothetical protein